MRSVGNPRTHPITFSASATLLAEGARFNEEIHRLPTGCTTFIPKGVIRFRTHEEANRDQMECIAAGMARIARGRLMDEYAPPETLEDMKARQTMREKDVANRAVIERALELFKSENKR